MKILPTAAVFNTQVLADWWHSRVAVARGVLNTVSTATRGTISMAGTIRNRVDYINTVRSSKEDIIAQDTLEKRSRKVSGIRRGKVDANSQLLSLLKQATIGAATAPELFHRSQCLECEINLELHLRCSHSFFNAYTGNFCAGFPRCNS